MQDLPPGFRVRSTPQSPPPVIQGPPRQPSPQTGAQAQGDVLANELARMRVEAAEREAVAAAAEREEAYRLAYAQGSGLTDARAQIDNVIRNARQAIEIAQNNAGAVGRGRTYRGAADSILGGGGPTNDIDSLLNQIGSNTAFDRLQAMRDASPTGGALGQVSEIELQLLRDSIAPLGTDQSQEQFVQSMNDVIDRYSTIRDRLPTAEQWRSAVNAHRDNGGEGAPIWTPQLAEQFPARADTSGNREYGQSLNRLGENANVNEDRSVVFNLLGQDTGPQDNSDQIRRYVSGMMTAGASPGEIQQNVRSIFNVEISPTDPGLAHYGRTGENPGISVDAVEQPTGASVGPIGTGAISAVDALTLNTGSAIASQTNPDAYAGLQQARADNPGAAFVGDTTGYIASGIAGGSAASALAPRLASSRLAGYGANAAEGAIVGQNTAGDPFTGAGGGILGRFIGGRIAAPNRDAARTDALAMNDVGIRMTPGQIMGGTARRFEDAVSGVPVLNAQLIARQHEGLGDFNRAVVNEALAPIGQRFGRDVMAGNDLMARAQTASNDAFGVLDNFSAVPDRQLAERLTDIRNRVGQMPEEYSRNFSALWDDDIGFLVQNAHRNGPISGREMQSIRQTLNGELNRVTGPNMTPVERRYADALREARDEVQNWVGRADPDVAQGYNSANQAWENMQAVNRGASASVQDGPFTPAQYLRGIRSQDGRAAFAAGTGRQASGQRLAQQAQEVLPNTVPNSGTTERAVATAMLGGSAAGAPVLGPMTALPLAGAAALSSPARTAFQRTVLGTPGKEYGPVRDFIRRRALTGTGLLGAAGSVGLLNGY